MKRTSVLLLLAVYSGMSLLAQAASYYSDPVGGSMTNDGSQDHPWGNLEAIFQAKKTFNAGVKASGSAPY